MRRMTLASFGAIGRALTVAVLGGVLALSAAPARADANTLRQIYAAVGDQMRNNDIDRELHIESSHTGDSLRGDVYAVLDHSFVTLRQALRDPARWCDVLILPFNTKYCHAVDTGQGPALVVRIGRKYDQPLQNAYRLDFAYRNVAAAQDYFESRLDADAGPLGTRDYRFVLSAIPVGTRKTFVHLSYSYQYGLAGRLAMQAYLATAGADKIGFTVVARPPDGQPQYIGGFRGAVERNAMRYYLAIDSFLASLNHPPGRQVERRIQNWFTATERYPEQLREMDRPTYVGMKLFEVERQRTWIQ